MDRRRNITGIALAAALVAVVVLLVAVDIPGSLSAAGNDPAGFDRAGGEGAPGEVIEQSLSDRSVTLELDRGDNLADLFEKAGMTDREAYDVSMSLSDVLDMTRIQEGQEVEVTFKGSSGPELVRIPVQYNKTIVARNENGSWRSSREWKYFNTVTTVARATVDSSLFQAAKDGGIPLSVMMEAIELFSFEVDFQRDIQSGEEITLLYEQLIDENGELAATGNLLYARLKLADRSVNAWRYERLDGDVGYYELDGASVRKALLKTPVNGARITSSFGYRTHPILGYTGLHRGMDFAVPTGTPVFAAGDGVVTIAGWHNDYGWRVKLSHGNHYDTMYAHFSSIAAGIRPGVRVKQGQVVGYVGSTGMSTGPHCHYEVHYYGSPVNPATLKFPPGHSLKDQDLELFQMDVAALKAEFSLD